MPERVPPSERTKDALRQLFTEATEGDVKSDLVRLSIRQIVGQAPEGAMRDLPGRDRLERRIMKNSPRGTSATLSRSICFSTAWQNG